MGLPEMLELQASYDEVVQELRGLEVERETLLFQVDVLQDTLEGVEELLAEAQREAGEANMKLEQEREAKKKLERMVSSLMQEVEKLKEERNNKPVNTHDDARQGYSMTNEPIQATQRDEPSSSVLDSHSSRRAPEGGEPGVSTDNEGSILTKLRKVVTKPFGHVPSLALDNPTAEDGVLQRPYEHPINNRRDPSPDRNDSDSISAYEDASAETPEKDRVFPGEGDTLELPDDSEDAADSSLVNESKSDNPKNPEACVVS
ncbi:leucine-rich repeat flightless-interacting protein 1 isoform X2 [Betta splendens]|nr:leucine-rich repeat flightless-interacting protein 1 isoform X2 [Betta splendens]